MIKPIIKIHGIKTKLLPTIKELIPDDFSGRWIEPFCGSGVVGFNSLSNSALLCDSNKHIITLYNDIKYGSLTRDRLKTYLIIESNNLKCIPDYYYTVRNRFNKSSSSLDFLFLTKTCFNGVLRFNKNQNFNSPFCNNINKFSDKYVQTILHCFDKLVNLLSEKNVLFVSQNYSTTIDVATSDDIIYCDPPYLGRHTGYYTPWSKDDDATLFSMLKNSPCRFILSNWLSVGSDYNSHVLDYWKDFNIKYVSNKYMTGNKESRKDSVQEVIITNY